jgi:hypothetical protein
MESIAAGTLPFAPVTGIMDLQIESSFEDDRFEDEPTHTLPPVSLLLSRWMQHVPMRLEPFKYTHLDVPPGYVAGTVTVLASTVWASWCVLGRGPEKILNTGSVRRQGPDVAAAIRQLEQHSIAGERSRHDPILPLPTDLDASSLRSRPTHRRRWPPSRTTPPGSVPNSVPGSVPSSLPGSRGASGATPPRPASPRASPSRARSRTPRREAADRHLPSAQGQRLPPRCSRARCRRAGSVRALRTARPAPPRTTSRRPSRRQQAARPPQPALSPRASAGV